MIEEVYRRPPIRVALMGLGRAMFNDHFPVFVRHPALFEVVAACDTLKERRDLVKQHFPKCKMFRQFSDMLDERDIDLVDIATPTSSHLKDATRALATGRWVLLESPMVTTPDDTQILRGAATKAKNRLIIMERGMFAPDYLLAKQAMKDSRLGTIHSIRIRNSDYIRRDDWQCIKRLGGGACYYAMISPVMQALELLPVPPFQIWCDLKRVASLGDSEDCVRLCIKTRDEISADAEYSGGVLPGDEEPSFKIIGDRGSFTVWQGAKEGKARFIDPGHEFPRRRSSVRTPPLKDRHERFEIAEETVALPKGTLSGPSAFWRHVYDSVRSGSPFPVSLDASIEAVRFAYLMKKTSPYWSGN